MRTRYLYLLGLSLVFSSCELKPEKVKHHLSKRTVYVVPLKSEVENHSQTQKHTSYIEFVFQKYDLVNIKSLDSSIQVDLRYADTNNFLGINLYDGLKNAYFNCETALRVCAAQYYLKQINPELSLVVLDASRPHHIQQIMWDSLKMPPREKLSYLSPPEETSLHNYGCAIDATLMNIKTGELLDMGTLYDYFHKLAQPVYEAHFLKTGELSKEAYENRLILRKVMQKARLKGINTEWWHFSMCTKAEAIAQFPLIR